MATRRQPRYQPGDRIGDRYQVHKALMGGMGEVYLCLDDHEDLPVALKTFQLSHLQSFVDLSGRVNELPAAFTNEISTWIALENHPNIVRCYQIEILENLPFIVLEWVEGDTTRGVDLRDWLRHGKLELDLACNLFIDLCYGLDHASQKQPGIVHCDLKPENILITRERTAKITDFGLATIAQEAANFFDIETATDDTDTRTLTRLGNIAGTPLYMAPEQWQGHAVDARTDIYALGCILYEVLAGHYAFGGFTIQQVRQQHLYASVPQFSEEPESLFNDLLMRCLAKEPSERFASVAVLLQEMLQLYHQVFGRAPQVRSPGYDYAVGDLVNRATTYAVLQKYDRALDDFEQVIRRDPHHAYAYVNRGTLYEEQQQIARALQDYERAVMLDPSMKEARYNRGNMYYQLENYTDALADFHEAVRIDSKFAIAYNALGNTYNKLGDFEQAYDYLSKAISLEPTNALFYRNRGNLLYYQAQYEAAIGDYSRAVEHEPNFAEVFLRRGTAFLQLNAIAEAISDFEETLRLHPERQLEARAYYHLGNAYFRMQQYAQALPNLDRAIALDAEHVDASLSRSAVYYYLEDYERAIADGSRAIQLRPDSATAYVNRGTAYYAVQEDEAALADYKRALELDTTYAQAYVHIGALLGDQGKIEEALAYFEQAAALGDPRGAENAAVARQMLGLA